MNKAFSYIFSVLILSTFFLIGCVGSVNKNLRRFNKEFGAEIHSIVNDGIINKGEYKKLFDLFINNSNAPDSIFHEWLLNEHGIVSIDTASYLDTIKIYVETSGSMKGYVDIYDRYVGGNWNFKTIVPKIITNSLKNKQVKLYTISDKPKVYRKDYVKDFRRDLMAGRIFEGASTELNDVFSYMINNNKDNQVSILISDCILDFKGKLNNSSNKEIMSSEIIQTLDKKKDFSAIVFQYYSDFNGDYYFNEKNEQPFSGKLMKNHPFYIWVVGNKVSVKEFLRSRAIPEQFANIQPYGIENIALKKYEVLPKVKKGRVSIQNFNTLNIRSKPPYTYVVALELDDYYISNENTLNDSIVVKEDYLDITNTFVTKELLEEEYPRPYQKLKKKLYDKNYKWFVSTDIEDKINDIESTIHFVYQNSNWITDTNIDNDLYFSRNDMESLEKKTFVFGTLSNAFEQSLGKSNFFEFNITIIKK